jgi:MOSC domain-containing protein
MATQKSQTATSEELVASVVSLLRYPVKSMMGEELNAAEFTRHGLLGDRRFALVDSSTGKVASAKNPRKWPNLFDYRATFVEPPTAVSSLPAVRITFPDGSVATTEQGNLEPLLSEALGREVSFEEVKQGDAGPAPSTSAEPAAQAEEYWPDMEGLDYRNTVTEWDLPEGTFFDLASVHILTTATIDRLRELYPQGRFEVRRFRPNIVVRPPASEVGFVENSWVGRMLALGDEVRLNITGPCPRCVMTTLPQGDLPADPGVLRTAARENEANVGVYAEVIQGGTVRRGDPVTLA